MRFLFLMFIVVPIVEIMLLIEVGETIGTLNTAALVVLTAIIGSLMLRQQGLSTLTRAQERLGSGQIPINEVVEGLLLAVGGALLLTPGFATDGIGFACLLPFTRRWLASGLIKHVQVLTPGGQGQGEGFSHFHSQHFHRTQDGDIIEGEYEEHRQSGPHIKAPDEDKRDS